MRIRGHVVEARPGLVDPASRRLREAMREPRQAVVEDRLVDGGLEAPPRRRIRHREHEPVAAAPEVEAALGLDDHRQRCRRRRCRASRRAAGGRAGGRAARRRHEPPSAADHGPQAITSVSASSRRVSASVCSRSSTPSSCARRTSSRVDRGRVGHAVLGAEDGSEHVGRLEPLDERSVDALDRHPERRLHGPPRLERLEPRLGRRQEQVADLVEERRSELGEERDALLREPNLGARSRTAAGRRPSPARSIRPRPRRGRRARRRRRRPSASR